MKPEGHPSEQNIKADPELLAKGWVRRYLADAERAQEAIELYSSMGFEVKAEELRPESFGPKCGGCASAICRSYVLIYTRAASPTGKGQK